VEGKKIGNAQYKKNGSGAKVALRAHLTYIRTQHKSFIYDRVSLAFQTSDHIHPFLSTRGSQDHEKW
jgi:hypothetical protein